MTTDATLFKNLQKVTSKIHATDNIDEIILEVSNDICSVFEADRLTIYAVNEDRNAIVSKVKTGLNTTKDLILPIVPDLSVAGYVALYKKPVNIKDAYDEKELRAFDPPVTFLKELDKRVNYRTRQLLVAPILDPRGGDLLGVVQIINRLSKAPYTKAFEEAATELCRTLAIAFRQRTVRKPAVRSKFEFLVVEGLLSPTQFDVATTAARQREVDLEDYLRNECQMKDKELGEAMARYYRVPYEPFQAERAKPEELLKRLKREYWDKSSWLPLEEVGDAMIVLSADPHATNPREVANMLGKFKVEYRVCSRREFEATKELYFRTRRGLDIDPDEPVPEPEKPAVTNEPSESDNEVRRVVNKIIVDAKEMDASDIHIEPRPGNSPTRIRMRKDGSLLTYDEIPARLRNPVVNRIKIMSNLDIAEKRLPQNGKIKFKQFGPLDIELRVATLPTAGDVEDVVLRILASGKPIPLDRLGLSQRNFEALKQAVANPYGLFFVCGPTGSGKTTTLHSVLGHLNTEDTKIWTAEDPVEITQEGLRQVQINVKAKLTFAESMRAFLRADPDIIMVGEMRDEETAHTGIEASLTGHLVMATLHTNSAPESVTRLLDMKMDPLNFADALLGILAQRLARRLCVDCKKPREASPDEIKALLEEYSVELKNTEGWKQHPNAEYRKLYDEWAKRFGGDKGQITLYSPVGCEKCTKTGYRGRVGLHELLVGTDAIKKEIVNKAPVARLFAVGLEEGMRTLKQDGIEKVLQGLTDMDEVRSVCIK